MEKIKVIAKETGKDAKVCEIENTFAAFKEFVGGPIETHDHPAFGDIVIYYNRDKQNLSDEVSIMLGEDRDCICGKCLVVKQDIESDGESVSLTKEETEILLQDLRERGYVHINVTKAEALNLLEQQKMILREMKKQENEM